MSAHYVSGHAVMRHADRSVVGEYGSHWLAVEALLAMPDEEEIEPDALGREGGRSDCWVCGGKGVDYGETCMTCGGFGWVREERAQPSNGNPS